MRPKTKRYALRRRNPPGSPPGTLAIDPASAAPRLSVIRYTAGTLDESVVDDPTGLAAPEGGVLWLNVDGMGDAAMIERIARTFDLHPLAMEDAVTHHQRPKFEDYEQHDFIILRMPDVGTPGFATEQVALCLTSTGVITFQQHPGDVFDPVRARLRNHTSPIRARGADYLAYALIDAVIDAYFPVLEAVAERLETLETEVITRPDPGQIGDIHALKTELAALRGAVWPLRDMLAALQRDEGARIGAATRVYLRDCQDHAFQLLDMITSYREIATGLVDLHLSSQANRTNEVMQVLTLIATIFIPLTFVVGVYGMNFSPEAGPWNMPELRWRYGYPAVMAAMGAITLALVIWFRKKGWLGGQRR